MNKFTKKINVVDAVQFKSNLKSLSMIAELTNGFLNFNNKNPVDIVNAKKLELFSNSKSEMVEIIYDTEWLIRDSENRFFKYEDKYFKELYVTI